MYTGEYFAEEIYELFGGKKKRQERRKKRKLKKSEKKAKRKEKRKVRKETKTRFFDRIKAGIKAPYLLPLFPFFPMMRKALTKRNVKFEYGNLNDIAKKFYFSVVKEKNNFDSEVLAESMDVDPVTIGMIVTAVIKFIKNVVNKKKNKEVLTENEEQIEGILTEDEGKIAMETEVLQTVGRVLEKSHSGKDLIKNANIEYANLGKKVKILKDVEGVKKNVATLAPFLMIGLFIGLMFYKKK